MSDFFELDESVLIDMKNFAVKKAKYFAPKVTGKLKKSIKGRVEGNTIIIESNKNYAGFVEDGTEKMINAHGEHDIIHPVKVWKAKTDRGDAGTPQQMPYIKSALYVTAKNINKFIPEEILVNVEMIIE